MGLRVTVSRWGNSLAIRLPKAVVEQLGLKAGGNIELELQGDEARLSVGCNLPERYPTLEEMIAEIRRIKAMGVAEPEGVDWGPDVGAERLPDEDWSAEYAAWLEKQENSGSC